MIYVYIKSDYSKINLLKKNFPDMKFLLDDNIFTNSLQDGIFCYKNNIDNKFVFII